MSDETGASILETESYITALVFLTFLALFITFEKVLEWRRASLKRRRKFGLLAAVEASTSELMLFGVASLLLTIFQDSIASICIKAPSSASWTILSQLNGCPCCLKNTKSVTECFFEGEGCGPALCNCNDADPACLKASEAGERRLLAAARMPGTRGLLHDSYNAMQCVGINEYSQPECGNRPGYKQALSTNAIHQIHMFLFYIALCHIICGYVMIRISSARVDIWRQWLLDDDAHSKAVHEALQRFSKPQHNQPKAAMSLPNMGMPDSVGGSGEAAPTDDVVISHQPHPMTLSRCQSDMLPSIALELTPAGGRLDQDLARMLWRQTQKPINLMKDSVSKVSLQSIQPDTGRMQQSEAVTSLLNGENQLAGVGEHCTVADDSLPANESMSYLQGTCSEQQPAPDAVSGSADAADLRLPDEVLTEQANDWAGRQHIPAQRRPGWEWGICFLRQFHPQTVQHAEISIMRASFIFTHQPGKRFHFMDYILASMDDDCAKVVGLGPSGWLIVVAFVLLAGVIGWASAWFVLLAVILELIMNTKLIYIARHTSRGGTVHRLKPTIFWFGAKGPWVMLTTIRTLLFFCSFIYSSCIFFAVNFGRKSCFFTTPGLNTASLPIPWWVVLIINSLVYFALSFITVPLYSIGVQMGSDFKPHIFSPDVTAYSETQPAQ
ncbi:hypothetical protein WJX77_002067 [Trebouxia sp. C0004]